MNFSSTACLALVSILSHGLFAQGSPGKRATDSVPGAGPAPAKTSADSAESAERAMLEQKFKDTLTKSVFVGRWCMIDDGKLGQEHDDKYTIESANKIAQDLWLINARVQYGTKDLTVPVPVNVKWAGDTPVISITNLGIPGLGNYTARVVVYGNLYAGTWSAPDHGGELHGVILKQE